MAKRNKLKAPKPQETSRPSVYDRRAIQLPTHAETGFVEITDPYAIVEPAEAVERNGVIVWTTKQKDKLLVAQSFKKDPIGRMRARDQIPEAEYNAARELQRLHDEAQIGVIKAMDPAKEYVDGGLLPDVLTDRQQRAIRQIRAVEAGIRKAHGWHGLSLINAILVEKRTLEQAARERGANTRRKIEFWCGLFHQCLYSLGVEMGTIRGAAA